MERFDSLVGIADRIAGFGILTFGILLATFPVAFAIACAIVGVCL